MIENTSPEFDHQPFSNGPLFQWLGVQWQGHNFAVSLNSIAAVFKAPQIPSTPPSLLDVAVHDGHAVFMKAFSECFALPPKLSFMVTSEQPQWAIALHSTWPAAVGCRVQSVMGPFWAKAGLASLEHDGQQWTVIYQSGKISGEVHA